MDKHSHSIPRYDTSFKDLIDILDNLTFPIVTNTFSRFLHEMRVKGHIIFKEVGIPTTSRGAEQYKASLFPDFDTLNSLLEYLKDKVTLDIGSGLTHRNPYSLANVLLRKYPDALYAGVEPRGIDEFNNCDWDRLKNKIRNNREAIGLELCDTPAETEVICSTAQEIPLPDSSVDIITSNNLFPCWIYDKKISFQIIQEFTRVLKENGQIRLCPIKLLEHQWIFSKYSCIGEYINKHYDSCTLKRKDNLNQYNTVLLEKK